MFFKRPSLKRGGMPTGIDTLSPRVQANSGFFGTSQIRPMPSITGDFGRYNVGLSGGELPFQERMMKSFPLNAAEMGVASVVKPTRTTTATENIDISGLDSDFDVTKTVTLPDGSTKQAIVPPEMSNLVKLNLGIIDRDEYNKLEKEKNITETKKESEKFLPEPGPEKGVNFDKIAEEVVTNKKGITTDSVIKEDADPFKTEYEKQYERLEKYLGSDKSEDKGRLALALSEAIGTPGSLADKASVLNKSLLNIMAGRKKDKKDLAKLAYSATVELEKANIAAGKKSFEERRYEKLFDSAEIIRNPDKYSESEVKAAKSYLENTSAIQNLLKDKKGDFTLTGSTLVGIVDNVPKTQKKLAKELAKGEDADQSKIAQYQKELEIANAILSKDLSAVQEALNFAKGGRVNYAMGTPNPNTQTIDKTPTASVDRLDYNALRTRLPKEISDDIIRLLANDDQALQDFAYIKTQGDVGKFNLKYGVNLVLPPESV